MSIPHPIPYQGSKRQLAPDILSYFPDSVDRLVEPFAGSGALSIAAAYHGKADCFWLNDMNPALIELWRAIVHHPERLAHYYDYLWRAQAGRERRYYDLVRARFNQRPRPYYFLYLLARCVKASVRYNAQGQFNQSPDNRRKGRHPDAMKRDIIATSRLLNQRVLLTAEDYRAVLRAVTRNDLVYLDPPYQGVVTTRDPRYLHGVRLDAFIDALDDLNQRGIAYMVSYDGRSGDKVYGQPLPAWLNLTHLELDAGRSSQSTLLGGSARTVESLYIAPALQARLGLSVDPQATPPIQPYLL
jgi:DNA adenine methylase